MSAWDGIDEFISVATTGSFTRGAKALGVSTTHVSRSIMALERRVQAQLFHRTTRSVGLTDTGRVFFERCERIAEDRDEAIALIGDRSAPQGELRVTCSTAMGERFVAPIIRRFAMQHPKLAISIELSNRVIDLVGEGFDLAVRTGTITDPRLIATRVASRSLYTCAAPSYLASAGRPARVKALEEHECIAGTASAWHFTVDGREIIHRPKGRFRCNSGHAVMEACISGLGICQLPDFYVLPYIKHGMVELLLEDVQAADEPIWAVYPQRRHLLPKVQQVVDCLIHELGPAMNSRGSSISSS
ncbi:LysR family transcriptional regulator [Sphingobium lactosutens]|uniref:LysR family transcriptional regulator n=1 Tax=Sphingobium lactosutens TaxID=522773 RepID=UPI0015BA7442|nr:LysR family transcriptional regulator [Sphingobium lactosutens]NWK98999.1 LysR family transcriptional regulator [Sphingobium lactosutens]